MRAEKTDRSPGQGGGRGGASARHYAGMAAGLLALTLAAPVAAQTVSGLLFDDRDGDGIHDPGEPFLAGIQVNLAGMQSGAVPLAISTTSGADGVFQFAPGDGAYLLAPVDPAGWRLGPSRSDGFPAGAAPYGVPVGQPRFAKLDRGIANLADGAYRMTVIGDSIAVNFSLCQLGQGFAYSEAVLDRIGQTTGSPTTLMLDEEAFSGAHTDDLHDPLSANYVRQIIGFSPPPDLVTLSLIGNDLLGVEPAGPLNQGDINLLARELQDARQNLQEALSALTSSLPDADVVLNTLYDNEADQCSTTGLHRTWIPILDRILRDLAWGQARRASINEVAAEFAHEDQLGACTGFAGMICQGFLGLDGIHPNATGYTIVREKLWEAAGGMLLGAADAVDRTSIGGIDYGYLRRIARLYPTLWETRGGAAVVDAAAALTDQDDGAPATVTLGAGAEEFRLAGIPDWFDEFTIVRTIAGVRYRTTGMVADDFYRIQASVSDQFEAPPGHDYTPTNWNFFTPLVGAGGPNQPVAGDFPGAEVLVLPDVPAYREVTASLTKNPTLPAGAAEYEWPPVTHADLTTTTFRVVAAPVAGTPGNDHYEVEVDAVWLDLYGWEKPRPAEVDGIEVERLPDGRLAVSFAALAGAVRYNLYVGGLQAMRNGDYDHGGAAPAAPGCASALNDIGGGRFEIVVDTGSLPPDDIYILVTAHDGNDVESPAGFDSLLVEIDRSQSICR